MEVLSVRLDEHVTEERMLAALQSIEPEIKEGPYCLIVEVEYAGLDMGARHVVVNWVSRRTDVIRRVAVVSDSDMWTLLVSTMASILKVQMVVFEDIEKARQWARQSYL